MLVREGPQVAILDLPTSKGAEVAKALGGSSSIAAFEGQIAYTAASASRRSRSTSGSDRVNVVIGAGSAATPEFG